MPLDYAAKYDVASEASDSILSSAANFTIATGADVVATFWNSFTPQDMNISTRDLLEKVDNDALALYNEHSDAVHTASLIAGAFVPGGISLKLLGRMRMGVTAAGYTEKGIASAVRGAFTGQRQKKLELEIEQTFARSGPATSELKNLQRQLYTSNMGKEVIDNAIIELAVVGSMNAHPYMEDYLKDPLSNFAVGTAVGGVLGIGIAIPLTGAIIRGVKAPIETATHAKILESGYDPIYFRDNSLSNGAAIQRHSANMAILDNIMIDKNETQLVKSIAERLRKAEGEDQANAVMRAAPWMSADKNKGWVTDEIKLSVLNILKDSKFAGVDEIQWIDLAKAGKGDVKNVFFDTPEAIAETLKIYKDAKQTFDGKLISTNFTTPDGKPAIAFVRPSTGETFAGNVRNVALAVDIRTAKAQIALAGETKQTGIFIAPNAGTFEQRMFQTRSAAQDDLDFLKELKRASMLKKEDVPYVTIASDDISRMNAMLSHLSKMTPEEQAGFKVRFRNDYPTFDAQVQQIVKKVESGGLGVAPDYMKQVRRFSAPDVQISLGMYNKVGRVAKQALDDWQSAPGHSSIEIDLLAAFAGRGPGDRSVGAELYNAGADFRREMRKHANAEGFVYLYRAMQKDVQSTAAGLHRIAEGYSIFPLSKFGKPKLFPIHVDSIVGVIGHPKEFHDEVEMIVMSGRPKSVDPRALSGSTKETFTEVKAEPVHIDAKPSIENITAEQLYTKLAEETNRQIKDLISLKTMSFEEISARTNVTRAGVEAVAAGQDLATFPAQWRRYTDVKDIDEKYLNPTNKLYALLGNPEKNPNSAAMAKLDDRSYTQAQRQIFDQQTMQSNSMLGNDALTLYRGKDMALQLETMRNRLAEVGTANVGSAKFQSADQMLRHLGPLGETITYLGKQLIDKVDAMKTRLLEPLSSAFTPFRGQPELFAEFNNTVNTLYSLNGWRDLRVDADTGWGYIVQKQSVEGKIAEVPLKKPDGTVFYVKQKEVLTALESTRTVSNEMLKAHNLIRAMTGNSPLNDMGFYLPPINLTGRNVAYVIDNTGKEGVQLLVANKADELESLMAAYKTEHASDFSSGKLTLNTKAEMSEYNLAKGYTDQQPFVSYASKSDTALFHTGSSAQKIVPSDDRFVNNIMSGYENVIISSYRKYADVYLSDITSRLDKFSDFYTRSVDEQPKFGLFKEKAHDPAQLVKNVLLGRDQLETSTGLKAVNSLTDFLYNRAATAVNSVAKSFQTEKVGSKEFFDSLVETLRQKGIDSPWKSFDEYLATTVAETRNIAPKIQSAANGLLATMNLRMFEVAQAAVNVMSLPILTWSALMERLPATVLNPQGNSVKFPLAIMMDGMRSMFGPEAKMLEQRWESAGLLRQVTRQYTETTATLKGAGQGREFMDRAVEAANSLQNNSWVKDVFSKPADFAEELTRKFAMHTGYRAAKQAYPGIDDTAATIAAVAFADRSIGNYHAAQRPALFQGTFGAAIGLYQTYVLTYAQSIYRGIENKNLPQLASLAIAQSGIFGISSWPGYHTLSEQVVGKFSDQHVDLTTGTYRAVQDDAAKLVLYGLPSSLGPAFYTRGDVSPRIPSAAGEIAVFNGIKQGWSAATQIIHKAGEGLQNGTMAQSMLEALSLQSLNRPIARWSELVSGSSITQQFNTVTPTSEMFTPAGVFSRLIGTRPVEEQVTRNAVYLNRYYEAMDKERRDAAVDQLATGLRNGSMSDTLMSDTAEKYLRAGGHARGWQSALNQVLLQSAEGTRLTLLRKLEPTSPLNMMIRDLY